MAKNIFYFVFVFAIMVASFGVVSKIIIAQDQSPQELAKKDALSNQVQGREINMDEIMEEVLPNNKQSCNAKMGLFMAAAKAYEEGKPLEQLVPMKFLQPMMEEHYINLKKMGLENAYVNDMLQYQQCVRSAKAHKDPTIERELVKKHKECVRFADIMLGTLEGVKARKRVQTIIKPYENAEPSMKSTAFSSLNRPILLFVGEIYKAAKKDSYKRAVKNAHSLVLGCGG